MSTKVTEGIQSSSLAFLNLHKRQNVSKSKVEEEFVQKAWNTSSAGFGGNNVVYRGEPKRKFNFKLNDAAGRFFSVEKNTETLHCRLLGTDYKSVKRKSMLEIGNIGTDFFPPSTKNTCPVTSPLNTAQFLQSLNKSHKGSKDKQKSENICVTRKQKNNLFHSIENPFKKDITHVSYNPLAKRYSDSERKVISDVSSEPSMEQENRHRKRRVPDCSLIDPSLNFRSPCPAKDVLKKPIIPSIVHHSNSFSEVTHRKKMEPSLEQENAYRKRKVPNSSFIEPSLNFTSPCTVKDVLKKSVVPSIVCHSDSFSEAAASKTMEPSVEQENRYRKKTVPDGSFIQPSLDFPSPCTVKDVLKKSLVQSIGHHSDSCSEVAPRKKTKNCVTPSRFYQSEEDTCSVSLILPSIEGNFLSNLNTSRAYLNNCTDSKGSNWVQSLQWTPSEHDDSDHKDRPKKRTIRNLLQGGYAEQLLKLQRREQSEKIIWKHKMEKNKEKAGKSTLSLLITAISHTRNFVTVKTRSLDFVALPQTVQDISTHTDISDRVLLPNAPMLDELIDSSNLPQSKLFLVLFKKTHFNQLHLKVKDVFRLHPPWQMLKSSPFNIILCAYFLEHIPQSSENSLFEAGISNNIEHSSIPPSLSSGILSTDVSKVHQCSAVVNDLIFSWGESLTLNGRVQRIWYHQVHLPENFPKDIKHYRFSLLLQDQNGNFHEVLFITNYLLPDLWLYFAMSAEGKCFGFTNLRLSHRLPLKKHKALMKFLEPFAGHRNVEEQEFMYQLIFDISSKVPQEVDSKNYPPYCQDQVKPMSDLLEISTLQRFSCIGKILFEHENVFFVSDESLLHEPVTKFFQLQLLFPFETKSLLLGSAVYIKEALFSEGHLVLDRYSHFTVISGAVSLPKNIAMCGDVKLEWLTLMKIQSLVMPLNSHCKDTDIVTIEGVIVGVDESSAFSFLQCCFCSQENLVQDNNLVIYCEDCSQVVPKPILKIKLEASICCHGLDSVSAHVQLTSATIKKILQICDDAQQPHCKVADVLGRNIGPILCHIRSCDSIGNKQKFYLSEIQSS